ncbi:MAG: hypothetical protein JWN73_4397 [Betaproteobacteria bacterium]|nr:hypothetical protein [Betaproteobacteria bacterium]
MKILKRALPRSAFAVLSLFLPTALQAQNVCEAFVKYGVYDTQTKTSNTNKAESFRSWFCQSKFESKQAADTAGLSLGYGGMTLGFDSSNESWSDFSSKYCRDDSYSAKYQEATTSFIKTISAKASDNMLACFTRGGLHARIIPGVGRKTFFVQARMNPTGTVTKASVFEFSVTGGTCTGPIKNGFEITSAGAEQICQRSGEEAVDISLSTGEQVNWDTPRGLIPIVKYPPPPTKQRVEIRAQDFVRGTNVGIDQCVVGPGTLANGKPCNARPNAAEFDFTANVPGAYRLDINFASGQVRPVKVTLNGKVVRDQALSETTGGFLNSDLKWSQIGRVALKKGDNTIRLERGDVFPHIHDLRLIPVAD